MKISIEFNIEKVNLEQYVWDKVFEDFKKFVKNYMVDKYNKKEYEKAEAWKEILEHLYYLEHKKWKFSWLSFLNK